MSITAAIIRERDKLETGLAYLDPWSRIFALHLSRTTRLDFESACKMIAGLKIARTVPASEDDFIAIINGGRI